MENHTKIGVAEKVKGILVETGLNQKELATLLEIPLDRVKSLATGRVKKFTRHEGLILIKELHVRPEWLGEGVGDVLQSTAEAKLQRSFSNLEIATQQAGSLGGSESKKRHAQEALFTQRDVITVPLVQAHLSAGNGSLEADGEIVGQISFERKWLSRKGQPGEMVLMTVNGESMEPEIKHGDVVLIDQSQNKMIGGAFFAVGVEDTVYIKRVDALPGQLILSSVNKAYPPITVDLRGDLADSVRIIGRVVWWCREAPH